MDSKLTVNFTLNNGKNSSKTLSGLDATEASDMTVAKSFAAKLKKVVDGSPTKYSLYKGETADYID